MLSDTLCDTWGESMHEMAASACTSTEEHMATAALAKHTLLCYGVLCCVCSVNDWTLGLLYRVHSSSSIWLQAAGMYKVRPMPARTAEYRRAWSLQQ